MAAGSTVSISRWRHLCVVVALWIGAASAEDAIALPTPEQGVERVHAAKDAAYLEVLGQYDVAAKHAPTDVALAVARCNYISSFTDDESSDWVESASEDFDACLARLEETFAHAPEVQVFKVQNLWGEEAVKQGEALLVRSQQWPVPLRRDLLAKLSEANDFADNKPRAGQLAVMAVDLGEHSLVPEAVEYLTGKRNYVAAIAVLRGSPPATDQWQARRRVEAALGIPERKWARWELSRYAQAKFKVSADVAARAYLHAGDSAAARVLLKPEDDVFPDSVRFDVLMAAHEPRAAAELVDLTDVDEIGENGRRFVTVLARSPATLFTGPMLKAALICLAALGAMALFPGLLLVPAHYRSLIRRSRGQLARLPIFETVGLRHAWVGMALVIVVPMVVAALVEPDIAGVFIGGQAPEDAARFFRATLWGTFAGLLCMLVVARKMPLRELFGDRNALRQGGWVVGIWVALVVGSALISMAGSHAGHGGNAPSSHTQMMDALADGGRDTVGPWVALLLPALLVPIYEELSFRGLLLGGLTRHLSFGWANTIQAAVFAAIHDDPSRLPFYFAIGLTTGWLVKKTRSLGPAIVLHALNNAVAFSSKLF